MATDVTDLTFETEVIERSDERPVIVDLWAPWCGPCRTLGPILEKVVEERGGAVELVKVNVDENPQVSAAFKVQSIPAVYAMSGGKVIDGFVGALPEDQVRAFLDRLAKQSQPEPSEVEQLVTAGDEQSLRRAIELEPDHPGAIVALAACLIDADNNEEALALLARLPESTETRHLAARARLATSELGAVLAEDQLEPHLYQLLEKVRTDDEARQEYLDILDAMEPDDPRRSKFRRALSSRIF